MFPDKAPQALDKQSNHSTVTFFNIATRSCWARGSVMTTELLIPF